MGELVPPEVLERRRREREARLERQWPPASPLLGDGPAEVTVLGARERRTC
jgi:hypothetical protein